MEGVVVVSPRIRRRSKASRFALAALLSGAAWCSLGSPEVFAAGGTGGTSALNGGIGGATSTTGAGSFGGAGADYFGYAGGGGGGGAGSVGGKGGNGNGYGGAGGAGGAAPGQNGSAGSDGAAGGDNGGGGGGGAHGLIQANVANTAPLTGGNGGNGGNGAIGSTAGSGGGGGGDGALGLVITGTGASSNSSTITGGNGGNGGNGVGTIGGSGGDGGAGVFLSAAGIEFTNTGTIAGGNGGVGGKGDTHGPNGAHGEGLYGLVAPGNVTVINSGLIAGGLGGDGVTRGAAVRFFAGTNTLELRHGFSFLGDIAGGSGADTLCLGGEIDSSIDFDTVNVLNFEFLTKSGTSTWTMSGTFGAHTFNVGEGAIYVNGSLGGTTTVASGATLGGNGTITGDVSNSGIIDPGAGPGQIGQLTIDGQFITTSTSVIKIDFDGSTADVIRQTGSNPLVTLNGKVVVNALPGVTTTTPNQNFLFLTANGGVTPGADLTIEDNLALFDAFLFFDNDQAYFYFKQTATFADFAITPHQFAVATYLDSTKLNATGDFTAIVDELHSLSGHQLPAVYNQLGGQSYGTTGQASVAMTTLWLQSLGSRLGANTFHGPGSGGTTVNVMSRGTPGTGLTITPISDIRVDPYRWTGWSVGYALGGSASSDGNASGAS